MSANVRLFWFMGKPALITPRLFLAVFATTVGSSLLFGYSMAVLNNLESRIKCFLLPDYCTASSDNDIEMKANALYASLTTTYIVLGTVGSFSSGFVSNMFGRRNSLLINNFIAVIGSVVNLLVLLTNNKVNMFIGRLILGLNAGLTTGIAPTFVAEISPTEIRGTLMACHQLCITIGIAVAYLLTMTFTLNNRFWIVSLALPLLPAVMSLIILPFCPESPRYLFVNKKDETQAKQSFETYNQVQDANSQLQEINTEVQTQKELPEFKILDLFTSTNYRKAVIISIVLNVMQQFSGINAVIGYSQNMMQSARVPKSYLELCVLLIGLLNMVSTIPAVLLMEIMGRRSLLIFPSLLSIISLIICFITIGILPSVNSTYSPIWAILAVVGICTYILGFALGMGPIPGIIVAEMFTQAPRAAAYSLALGIQWFSSFIILFLYPIINGLLPAGYVFLIFIGFTVPSLAFLVMVMPETKNRSFADIATALAGNKVTAQSV